MNLFAKLFDTKFNQAKYLDVNMHVAKADLESALWHLEHYQHEVYKLRARVTRLELARDKLP